MAVLLAKLRQRYGDDRLMRWVYFFGAVLLHLILILIVATIVVWQAKPPPPSDIFQGVSIQAPPPPPVPPSSGASAENPQFEPQSVVVPVSTPRSVLTANATTPFTVDTSKAVSEAVSHLSLPAAEGTGLGKSGGAGDRGGGSDYGSSSGQGTGLVGVMYDLKQTPDGQPTDMAENDVEKTSMIDPAWQTGKPKRNQVDLLRKFVVSWNMGLFEDYYKAPMTLVTPQICILQKPSVDAPKAFGAGDTIKGRRWIVVYHTKIIPPDSGRYRFIGFGDDFLVVRINDLNVLDGSYPDLGEALDQSANNLKEDVGGTAHYVAYHCGNWVDMTAGISMDMQVLIGEGPGGESGFILMIQKEGDGSPKGDYPVFQLHDTPIPAADSLIPPSKKKMLFQVSS
jgi:hypothetical protein